MFKKIKIDKIFLISLIINILIRIPRMMYPHGLDGMYVLWEAKHILTGAYFSNGVDFFYLLGLYKFSGYPIGSLLIMSFFLIITKSNIIASVYLYTVIFTILFVYSTYILSKELKLNSYTSFLFIMFTTTIPNILLFSYYTSSARFPLFATIPLVLTLLLKWYKSNKTKYLIYSLLITIVLNFIHRASLILFLIILIFSFLKLLSLKSTDDILIKMHTFNENQLNELDYENSKKMKLLLVKKYLKERIWIFGYIFAFVFSLIFFNIFNLSSAWRTIEFDIYCYLTLICDSQFLYALLQPLVESWFQYGLSFVFFIFSIVFLLLPRSNVFLRMINSNLQYLLIFISLMPLVFVYDIVYSIYYIFIVLSLMSALFVNFIKENHSKFNLYFNVFATVTTSIFVILIHFIVGQILPYLILIIIWDVVLIFMVIVNKVKKINLKIPNKKVLILKKMKSLVILGTLLLTTLAIVDKQIIFYERNNFQKPYIIQEEIEIADFFISQGLGTFDSFDHTLSIHIAALSGWYFTRDFHSQSVFILRNQILNELNISINPLYSWFKGYFFDSSLISGSEIYIRLILSECLSFEAIFILKTYNIKYFITQKNSTTVTDFNGVINSTFIQSLHNYVPIALSTSNLNVWNVSKLYST